MGPGQHRLYDFASLTCFVGLTGLPIWFAVCALGPKLGLADGGYALEQLTLFWGVILSGVFVAAGLGALFFLLSYHRDNREMPPGSWVPIAGFAVALSALAASLSAAWLFQQQPAVSEVTTDGGNPPAFTEALVLRRGVKANTLDFADGYRPEAVIDPLVIEASADEVFDALLDIARDRRWRVGSVSRERDMVELTIESFWYAQTDDVVIRLSAEEAGGTRLDYRAAARTGARDGGRNARRLATIERGLRERLG
ncbi:MULTISPECIES: DUF1499 domain-containing protein [Hyphobacterium]|uniref:DUF1499 domain-containing protein n=1 Tax=Hyphobacterium vulgare TaxID=1736751 RepID=A0ABV6ZV09_9PROT